MKLIFRSVDYEVYLDRELMYFKSLNESLGRVLIITPPGIKPQFYSLVAVVLSKAGTNVSMPLRPMACNYESLNRDIEKFRIASNPDLTVILGFKVKLNDAVFIGFKEDLLKEQLSRAFVPGSMYPMDVNSCEELIRSLSRDLDMVISSLGIKDVLSIRDFVITRLRKLKNEVL